MEREDIIQAIKNRAGAMQNQVKKIKTEIKKYINDNTTIKESVETFLEDFQALCTEHKVSIKPTNDNLNKQLEKKLEECLKFCFGGDNWRIGLTFNVKSGLSYFMNRKLKPNNQTKKAKVNEKDDDYLVPQEFLFLRSQSVNIDFPTSDYTFNEVADTIIYSGLLEETINIPLEKYKDILNSLVYDPFRKAMDNASGIPLWGPINDDILSFINYEGVYEQIMKQFTGFFTKFK